MKKQVLSLSIQAGYLDLASSSEPCGQHRGYEPSDTLRLMMLDNRVALTSSDPDIMHKCMNATAFLTSFAACHSLLQAGHCRDINIVIDSLSEIEGMQS